jgi:hypothetical protein
LHGLTVGDVPTDLASNQGRCGVWLTSNVHPNGHGLEGSEADKSKYRLTVNAPENALLVKWVDWSAKHVTPETISALHRAAATRAAATFDDWYVYFGVIDRSAIEECVDMQTGKAVENWQDRTPSPLDVPPVPVWRRLAWHRKLLKNIARESFTPSVKARYYGFVELASVARRAAALLEIGFKTIAAASRALANYSEQLGFTWPASIAPNQVRRPVFAHSAALVCWRAI